MFYNVLQRPSVNMDGYGMPVSFGTTLPTATVPATPLAVPVAPYMPVVTPTDSYVAESWDPVQHWSAGADKVIPADAYQSNMRESKALIRDLRAQQHQMQQQMQAAMAQRQPAGQAMVPAWAWIVGLGLGAYAIFGKK